MPRVMHYLLGLSLIVIVSLNSSPLASRKIVAPSAPRYYLPLILRPPMVIVTNVHPWRPSQGTFGVIGELQNLSSSQTFSVTVEAEIINTISATVRTIPVEPVFDAIFPNAVNPFSIPLGPWDSVRQVTIQQVRALPPQAYRSLTILSPQITCGITFYATVDGMLRNESSVPLHAIQIGVWNLDTNVGQAVATGRAQPTTLQPGELAPFTAGLPVCFYGQLLPGISMRTFHIVAQGRVDE